MSTNQRLLTEPAAWSTPTKPRFTAATDDELKRRAAALQSMAALDTPPDEGFDALTRLAASVCQTPIAIVSLIDGERVWFKSVQGLSVTAIENRHSFCCEAANSKCLLEVSDARLDPRFANNAMVTGELGILYYAGAPIMYEGVGIGTVCVLDRAPRELAHQSLLALQELAKIATALLRARIEAFSFYSSTR